jgi:hypothetical protein
VSQHGNHVALYVLRSNRAARDLLSAECPSRTEPCYSSELAEGFVIGTVIGICSKVVTYVPLLRRVDEVLATGNLIDRGAVETAIYVVFATAWLLVVPMAETMSARPGTRLTCVRPGTLMIDSDGASAVLSLVICHGRTRVLSVWMIARGFRPSADSNTTKIVGSTPMGATP